MFAVVKSLKVLFYFTGITVLACAMFFLCAPDKPSNESNNSLNSDYPGMRKIFSAGKSFLQGANDSLASVSDWEKPLMTCAFTYNYWIDTAEVTQKEYFEVTGKTPVSDTVKNGKGDNYPVFYVNWYDAILFCNAKSKAADLDTVYSYFSKDTLSTGLINSITGLIIHYDRNGYRLPTEAEWEYAAREGSSSIPSPHLANISQAELSAWFDINSSNTVHPVAALSSNSFGLYDMAGNVYEWTGDWKGPYSDGRITNSIGAQNPDSYYERTIKGGSFKHSFFYLRPSRRSGTYQIALTIIADFLGFRCARGIIPDAVYCTADTASVVTNQWVVTSDTLNSFLGASRAKVVFENVTSTRRTLCAIDLSHGSYSTKEFTDITNVNVPVISPDGKFIAFCDRGEGLSGSAHVYIRYFDSLKASSWKLAADSAFVPRWWVDTTSKDTFIVYSNSCIDNQNSAWSSTKTFLQKISGGLPVGDPAVLTGNGSFHDGISPGGQYVATGYTECMMRNMTTGVYNQLFVCPYNGKSATGSSQVCNVSISNDPEHPDRCLFLDFGSQNQTSSLTLSSYGVHEYLFISEFTGNTLAWYKCPSSESSWNYPEWSNKSRFAIASGVNYSGDAHAIYAINLDNKAYMQIVEGTELNHPYLWLDSIESSTQDSLNTDSLGIYNAPLLSSNQQGFSYKMHLFWKMHKNLDVVCVGSSQVLNGIDCNKITDLVSVNMGYAAVGVYTCLNIIRKYILPSCPKVKLIVMSSAVYWLGNSGGDGDNTWDNAIVNSKGYVYDMNHNFWQYSVPKNFDSLIYKAPYTVFSVFDSLGLALADCGGWGGDSPDLSQVGNWDWSITDTNYLNNFNALVQLINELAKSDIHLLMVNFPESPAYKNTNHYTRNGPSWATGTAVVEQLKNLENSYSNFHFYDAYNGGNHDYADSEAQNWNHLCPTGAAKLTTRLDTLIHSILGH
jgi:uncharacterized protein (TIGR02171 family)